MQIHGQIKYDWCLQVKTLTVFEDFKKGTIIKNWPPTKEKK